MHTKHQRLISTVLIASGLLLILRASAWMVVSAHNHPPGEFLYRAEKLEREIEGDAGKLAQLEEERRAAGARAKGMADYSSRSLGWLLACGILNLYCGVALRPSGRNPKADQAG